MRKISVFFVGAALTVLLTGCTTTTWRKAGVSPQAGRDDIVNCAGDVGTKPFDSFSVRTFEEKKVWVFVPVLSGIDYDEFKKCMNAKGYKLSE